MKKTSYKAKLLTTFKDFIKYCNKYNIKYYCAFGTALGAVRHKGLIPWDDDIDVYMFRHDYQKLLKCYNNNPLENYEIIDPHYTKRYYLLCSKFCNKNSTILEKERKRCTFGIFVDIFILDKVNPMYKADSFSKLKFYKSLYVLSEVRYYWKELFQIKLKKLPIFIAIKLHIIALLKKIIIKKIDRTIQEYYCYNSKHLACFQEFGIPVQILNQEWFSQTIQMPFEDFIVSMPIGYKEYLSSTFGDYMTPPPIAERKSHEFTFLDTEKRVLLKDILKERNKK